MRWLLALLRVYCMLVIHCVIVMSVACALSRLYVRQARCSSDSWLNDSQLSCECFCLRSSIEISYLSSLLDMRLVLSRILVMKNSYECIESSILVADNWIDWFFRLKMLDTAFDEDVCIEECQDRIWSIYSSWFSIIAFKTVSSIDWFRSTSRNICDCSSSRALLVRSRRQKLKLIAV